MLPALIGSTLNATSRIAPALAGKWTFALFCHARPCKVLPAEREVYESAVVDKMVVNGNRIATYRWGNGKNPVLLLHGWASRSSRFASFVRMLRERGFTPISFDAPGHGDSKGQASILEYRAIVQRLFEQHGRFRAIIAHSFGVPCAFYALRMGVRAERVVAISGMCDYGYLVERFCQPLGLRASLLQAVRRRAEVFCAPETDIWNRFSLSYRPEQISVPILVIHDEDDRTVILEQAHRIVSAYGEQARLVVTRNLGHRRILRDPTVIETSVRFLAEAEPNSAPVETPQAPGFDGMS